MRETTIHRQTIEWLNSQDDKFLEKIFPKRLICIKIPDNMPGAGKMRFMARKYTDIVCVCGFIEVKMVKGSKTFNCNRLSDYQQDILGKYSGYVSIGFVEPKSKERRTDKETHNFFVPWKILSERKSWTISNLLELVAKEWAYLIYPKQIKN